MTHIKWSIERRRVKSTRRCAFRDDDNIPSLGLRSKEWRMTISTGTTNDRNERIKRLNQSKDKVRIQQQPWRRKRRDVKLTQSFIRVVHPFEASLLLSERSNACSAPFWFYYHCGSSVKNNGKIQCVSCRRMTFLKIDFVHTRSSIQHCMYIAWSDSIR